MKLIPLLLLIPFLSFAQTMEIRNESKLKPAKIAANFKGSPVAGEKYTIRGLVNPGNDVIFVFMCRDTVVRAEDCTESIKDGVKWVAKEGEDLVIIIKDKE